LQAERDIDLLFLSVCPSSTVIVRSNAHIGYRLIGSLFRHSGRTIILPLRYPPPLQKKLQKSNKKNLLGLINTPAVEKLRFSTGIAVFFLLENGTR